MMEIVNVRIDDRLIHGQVATVWSQVTRATRIMVVDDAVVKDPVNKEALKMACPSQCKLSILTVEKAAANLCAGKYEGERVFIVAKNPKTIRGIYEKGFHMEAVNVGNMGGKQNTNLKIFDTICRATEYRQSEAAELSEICQAIDRKSVV